MFGTALHERDAYRTIFSYGGTLSGLDTTQVRNVTAAVRNAREFMIEVVSMLTRAPARVDQTAEAG